MGGLVAAGHVLYVLDEVCEDGEDADCCAVAVSSWLMDRTSVLVAVSVLRPDCVLYLRLDTHRLWLG